MNRIIITFKGTLDDAVNYLHYIEESGLQCKIREHDEPMVEFIGSDIMFCSNGSVVIGGGLYDIRFDSRDFKSVRVIGEV